VRALLLPGAATLLLGATTLLLGAAPRVAGASRLVVTRSFDLVVQRSSATVDRDQSVQLDITAAPHADADDVALRIVASSATPFDRRHFPVKTQADDLHHYTAIVSFPDRGKWNLLFTVTPQIGPSETGVLTIAVTDSNGMTPSLAWAIGFSPLFALALFGLAEAARLQTGRVG
jgi:hypothetical protein